MASFRLGVGGVDNSHDCILLIQPHHLAFGKHIHQNYRVLHLRQTAFLIKLSFWRPRFFRIMYNVSGMILAKLIRTSACIILPIPDKNSLKNFKSRTIALSATLNIACHRSKNKSKALSSVQSLPGSFCLPHFFLHCFPFHENTQSSAYCSLHHPPEMK